jgi:hypothetical protein
LSATLFKSNLHKGKLELGEKAWAEEKQDNGHSGATIETNPQIATQNFPTRASVSTHTGEHCIEEQITTYV